MSRLEPLPVPGAETEDLLTRRRNARAGMVLFVLYLALYGAFVLVSAFWPTAMDVRPFAGINLAVLSGLGLIAAALFLALVYAWICRSAAAPPPGGEQGDYHR